MRIGYIFSIGQKRINTVPEQIKALEKAGCQIIFSDLFDVYLEKQSNLELALKYARTEDILVIWQIYCLAPSVRRFVKIAQKLQQQNIGLQILTGEASKIKPHTSESEEMIATISVFANLESQYASSRTKEELAKLKAQGKVLGRRSNFEYWKPKLIEMRQIGYSSYKMSKETGVCYQTVNKYLRRIDQES